MSYFRSLLEAAMGDEEMPADMEAFERAVSDDTHARRHDAALATGGTRNDDDDDDDDDDDAYDDADDGSDDDDDEDYADGSARRKRNGRKKARKTRTLPIGFGNGSSGAHASERYYCTSLCLHERSS